MNGRIKIPGHIRTFVEGELREYHALLAKARRLKQEKDDIYNRTRQPIGEPVKGSHSGDPTSSAAIMAEKIDRQIVQSEYRIAKVNAGLSECTAQERELVEIRYLQAYEPTDEEAMAHLRYGNRGAYFNAKFSAIRNIANAWGLM